MIPYVGLGYFLLLLYPLAVLVALGVAGRLGRDAVLAVGVAMVLYQYAKVPAGQEWWQLAALLAYATGSIAAILGYAAVRRRPAARWAFRVAVTVVLAPVVAAKVAPLIRGHGGAVAAVAVGRHGRAVPGVPSVARGFFDTIGFVGMSYMVLRVLDVLLALRDGVLRETPAVRDLVSYLLFAPTISAGPIDRFRRFRGDLAALPRTRADYLHDVEAGIHRIAQGFLYKFILAYLIHRHALRPLGAAQGVLPTIGYMYAFSLYLFFDFAGYSAFAIGVARFFGVHVPENFDAPFRSRNFREIWERWHISLSSWLRDHVYMRFVLHAARRRWFGGDRQSAHLLGLVLTMALMGCWHGLQPQYVVYGLYQGAMLVAYDVVGRWLTRRGLTVEGRAVDVVLTVVTMHLFAFGLLVFSGRLFH